MLTSAPSNQSQSSWMTLRHLSRVAGVCVLLGSLSIVTSCGNSRTTASSSGSEASIGEAVIGVEGDGEGNALATAWRVLTTPTDNLLIAGYHSHKLFEISPDGDIDVVIDEFGDGQLDFRGNVINPCHNPDQYVYGADGNLYVACDGSRNVFKIEPDDTITEILDTVTEINRTHIPDWSGLAVSAFDVLFIGDAAADSVYAVPSGGGLVVTVDEDGDGMGAVLDNPSSFVGLPDGTYYVAGEDSDNAFVLSAFGVPTLSIDATGDGAGNTLDAPVGVIVGTDGNIYIAGRESDNVFQITPLGAITEITGRGGDLNDPVIERPLRLAISASHTLYVSDGEKNVWEIPSGEAPTMIVDGDEVRDALITISALGVDGDGNLIISGGPSDKVVRIVIAP